ncbi:MAG: MFS transporter [bacterium]|nr:MFS transporter [bacterium]
MRGNIWKLYTFKTLSWMLLILPVLIPFFQENGLDMQQILLLQAAFSTSLILFEVPSGYFADVIGRKFSLVIGSTFGAIGFGFYTLAYTFSDFLIVEILLGIGGSLISGADTALLYDTLIEIEKEEDYTRYAGRLGSVANFSEGFAALIGGELALISLRTPLYVEAVLAALCIPVALTLVEPARHTLPSHENSFKSILRIVRYALHGHAEIKWLILYSSLVGLSTFTIVWFVQPYLQAAEVPLRFFGLSWAILQFSVGIFALLAYRIERVFGRRKSLIALIFLSSAAYLLLSQFQSLWAVPIVLIFYFVRGINGPVLNDYLNRVVTSDIRATVLSVKSLMGRLMFVIFGPIIGWVHDTYSLGTAFMMAGMTFLVLGVFFLWRLQKNNVL